MDRYFWLEMVVFIKLLFKPAMYLAKGIGKTYKFIYSKIWSLIKFLFKYIPVTLIVNIIVIVLTCVVFAIPRDLGNLSLQFMVSNNIVDVDMGALKLTEFEDFYKYFLSLCYSKDTGENVTGVLVTAALMLTFVLLTPFCFNAIFVLYYWKVFVFSLIVDLLINVLKITYRRLIKRSKIENTN